MHVLVCICICVLESMCCLAQKCRCEKVRRTAWWENNSLVFHLICLVPSYLFHPLSHTLPCLYPHQWTRDTLTIVTVLRPFSLLGKSLRKP